MRRRKITDSVVCAVFKCRVLGFEPPRSLSLQGIKGVNHGAMIYLSRGSEELLRRTPVGSSQNEQMLGSGS